MAIDCYVGEHIQWNCLVCTVENRDYWSIIFWRVWGCSFNELWSLCEHDRRDPNLDEMDVGNVWFKQDGAMAHTVRTAMRVLREHFPGRLISLRGRSSVAAALTWFSPLRHFMRVSQINRAHWSSKDHCSPEGQYSPGNSQHTHRYAGKSRQTLQNSITSVYRQWGMPLAGYNF